MRADRLLAILMLLQGHGKMTTRILARELEVSQRTILRDVDALSTAGIPIQAEGGHGGGIYLAESYQLALSGLKGTEVSPLFVAGHSSLLDQLGMEHNAQSSLLKLFAALPSLHQRTVEQLRQRLYIDPVGWWQEFQPRPFWPELQKAIYEDWSIQVFYERGDGEVVERILEPYSLVAKAGLWYMVGRREGQFRTYRVSRLQQLSLLPTHFQRLNDFDLVAYWHGHLEEASSSFGKFKFTLRVPESSLPTLRRYFIELPILTAEEGWITAELRVETLETARTVVFGLGKGVTVLEPLELQEAVVKLARQVLGSHSQDFKTN